jgi:uncharacterized protein YecE (DUF72 family)
MSNSKNSINWFIGTIGFSYADWSDVFYPVGLKSRGYLPYYSRVFNCVEIDTTFYGIPREITVLRWAADTPQNFKFCLKTPRMVTHEMGLVGAEGLMAEFVDRAQLLGEKLGPILIQLPPSFSSDRQSVLEVFLSHLQPGVRYAIEVRSQSWYTATGENQAPALLDLLTHFGIAWVSIDYPGLPLQIVPTNDFIYLRWIGQHGSYDKHDHERIDRTARLLEWKSLITTAYGNTHSIFGLFNNDYAGYAAGTAQRFKQLIGLPHIEPQKPIQGQLF